MKESMSETSSQERLVQVPLYLHMAVDSFTFLLWTAKPVCGGQIYLSVVGSFTCLWWAVLPVCGGQLNLSVVGSFTCLWWAVLPVCGGQLGTMQFCYSKLHLVHVP